MVWCGVVWCGVLFVCLVFWILILCCSSAIIVVPYKQIFPSYHPPLHLPLLSSFLPSFLSLFFLLCLHLLITFFNFSHLPLPSSLFNPSHFFYHYNFYQFPPLSTGISMSMALREMQKASLRGMGSQLGKLRTNRLLDSGSRFLMSHF